MLKFLWILLAALVFEALGVVLLSGGLKEINGPKIVTVAEFGRLMKAGVTNPKILLGVFLEAIFFGALLYLLSQKDVSLIWPLTALGFVITGLAAKFFLHEHISGWRWAGIALIVIGAGLITYSEKLNERSAPPAKAESSKSLRPQ